MSSKHLCIGNCGRTVAGRTPSACVSYQVRAATRGPDVSSLAGPSARSRTFVSDIDEADAWRRCRHPDQEQIVNRCSVESSARGSDSRFVHTWRLRLPCGLSMVSHAQQPPVTVAARFSKCRQCPVKQPRTIRPEFMW